MQEGMRELPVFCRRGPDGNLLVVVLEDGVTTGPQRLSSEFAKVSENEG